MGYAKVLGDGTTLYIEEVRTGKNRLAMTSMRKYPAAKNATETLRTVLLNVRNDGGDVCILYPDSTSGQHDPANPDASFSRATMTAKLNQRGEHLPGKISRQYTPEQMAAMKHVGLSVETPSLKERAQALWKDAGKKLAQAIADARGVRTATDAIKAEVRALLEMANALGVDTESIMLDAHEQTRNATEQDYYEAAKPALEEAIARSNGDRGTTAGSESQGQEPAADAAEPAPLELTAPTVAEVTAQQDRVENAAKEEQAKRQAADAKARREADEREIKAWQEASADNFKLGQDPMDGLTGQGSIFDAPEAPSARDLKKNWPEGQQRTEQAVNSPHPLTVEAANPEADSPDARPADDSVALSANEEQLVPHWRGMRSHQCGHRQAGWYDPDQRI